MTRLVKPTEKPDLKKGVLLDTRMIAGNQHSSDPDTMNMGIKEKTSGIYGASCRGSRTYP